MIYKPTKHQLLSSMLLLFVLLLSAISHSHEYSLDASHQSEQLDCKLCQQNFDKPTTTLTLIAVNVGVFSQPVLPEFSTKLVTVQCQLPHTRAPPFSI